MHAKSLQSCSTLCDPMDCSPPGSSVHEIFQARILEWVVIPFSRGSSRPGDRTRISLSSALAGVPGPLAPPGKPNMCTYPKTYPQTSSILLAQLLPEHRLPACSDKQYEAPDSGSWPNRPDSQHLPLCALPATILWLDLLLQDDGESLTLTSRASLIPGYPTPSNPKWLKLATFFPHKSSNRKLFFFQWAQLF